MKRTLCLIALFVLISSLVHGQEQVQHPANALMIEGFGKSVQWFSITYEHYVYQDKIGIGAGLGLFDVSRGELPPLVVTGNNEAGNFTEIMLSAPIYGFASLGKGKHRAYLPVGISLFGTLAFQTFPDQRTRRLAVDPIPFLGAGYEYGGEKWFVRLPVYLLVFALADPDGWFPALPWIGIGGGRRF